MLIVSYHNHITYIKMLASRDLILASLYGLYDKCNNDKNDNNIKNRAC